MRNLELTRSIVFFDLETTGTDPARDRIVEIALMRIAPDRSRETRVHRVDPGRPIPAEATAVHGIRDEDVRGAPLFAQLAPSLVEFLGDADLAGFNVRRFDVPLLDREFRDCQIDWGLSRRLILDAMAVFHRKEPRDLSAAVRFYLARDHRDAHSAESDLQAAAEVLDAQLARYPDLPREVEALDAWCRPRAADAADQDGKFVWRGDEVVFSFGKHSGRTLREVAGSARDYLQWILRNEFPPEARRMVENALRGEFPKRSS